MVDVSRCHNRSPSLCRLTNTRNQLQHVFLHQHHYHNVFLGANLVWVEGGLWPVKHLPSHHHLWGTRQRHHWLGVGKKYHEVDPKLTGAVAKQWKVNKNFLDIFSTSHFLKLKSLFSTFPTWPYAWRLWRLDRFDRCSSRGWFQVSEQILTLIWQNTGWSLNSFFLSGGMRTTQYQATQHGKHHD